MKVSWMPILHCHKIKYLKLPDNWIIQVFLLKGWSCGVLCSHNKTRQGPMQLNTYSRNRRIFQIFPVIKNNLRNYWVKIANFSHIKQFHTTEIQCTICEVDERVNSSYGIPTLHLLPTINHKNFPIKGLHINIKEDISYKDPPHHFSNGQFYSRR